MNYQAFTNDSLTMMYEAVRGALSADNALTRQGMEKRFRVRETPDWKKHAADLEAEMLKRGMPLDIIDWSEDQARLPFEEQLRAPASFPAGVSFCGRLNHTVDLVELRISRLDSCWPE